MAPASLLTSAAAALLLLAPKPASASPFKLYTTVPGQATGTETSTSAAPTATADSTRLTAPAAPDPALGSTNWYWTIPPSTADVVANTATTGLGVSRVQQGNFYGLSVELSVVNRVCECGGPRLRCAPVGPGFKGRRGRRG